jgi:predicted nucleic acid-binding protein
MSEKYYFDTCIWRDHYENRYSLGGKPLGEYASKLFMRIIRNKDVLFFSEFIVRELKSDFDEKEINGMLNVLFRAGILKRVEVSEDNYKEARKIGTEKNLPPGDVLHAILARDNNAVLVSQDEHHQRLKNIVKVKKPEQII